MSKNFVLVTGNLGNDIELKVFDNNKRVCNFSIAESYPTSKKDKNGNTIYETRWHQITAWDGLAQKMSDYAVKRQPIQASGYLDYDEFKKITRTTKRQRSLQMKLSYMPSLIIQKEEAQRSKWHR
jgi:single-strand DNA-binding protein